MGNPFTPRIPILLFAENEEGQIVSLGKCRRWNQEDRRHDRQWNKRRMSKRLKRLNR